VAGDPEHPANQGRLCVKGSALAETQIARGRLLEPRIGGRNVTWDRALDRVALEFRRVLARQGPEAVALYLSGQLLTEDYYVANKLMKGFVGSGNVDTNSRLCMASAVAAHQRAFGEDVVPCDYGDLDHCELLVLVGSNAAWAHPVLFQRVAARRARGELRVVVIDPRRTATCDAADLHLALVPGSDVALFNALLVHLAAAGALDQRYADAHTEGLAVALQSARGDAAQVQTLTGLPRDGLERFFRWFASTPRTVTMFSQGVNQASNGTDKANAIINCHLATGRLGRVGMGPFSITGQPNAMGGREVGGMATQLAAHADFTAADRDRVGRFWGAPALAREPGLKAVDMFDAVARGEIRAIWIMGTNPVVSLPRADVVRDALRACPFVVVSDCVARTDTAACADVLLPAAGWGEKDGTVTNSERRISRQRAFLPAPGQTRPDWWIITQVARRLGFASAFGYDSAHEIFSEHAALSAFENDGRRLFDIGRLAGLSRSEYDALTPTRWPAPLASAGDLPARPFANGAFPTANGRARLVAVRHQPPAQQVSERFPFVLNTGRLRDQWHTMTRTGTVPRLFGHTDLPVVQIPHADARRLGIEAGDLVELANDGGSALVIAQPSGDVAEGQLFLPMHWTRQFTGCARVGVLVGGVTDCHSGQPESKHAVVSLRRCETGAWLRLASAVSLPSHLLAPPVRFWTRLPAEHGWRYEIALAPDQNVDAFLQRLLAAVDHANAVTLTDTGAADRRVLLERAGATVLAAFCHQRRSELPSRTFVAELLAGHPGQAPWRLLAAPDGGAADYSRVICTCFGVSEDVVRRAVLAGARTAAELGSQLRCGTNCGSCVPELRTLIQQAFETGEPSHAANG
jgi:assimilatory nitrate reductase catalytic subunit